MKNLEAIAREFVSLDDCDGYANDIAKAFRDRTPYGPPLERMLAAFGEYLLQQQRGEPVAWMAPFGHCMSSEQKSLTKDEHAAEYNMPIYRLSDVLGDVASESDPRSPALPIPSAQAPAAGQLPSIAIANPTADGFGDGGLPLDGRWNWPEDYEGENGQYMHRCKCGRTFHGHKRRIFCKVCDTEAADVVSKARSAMEGITPLLWRVMGLSGEHKIIYERGFIDGYCVERHSEADAPK